MSLSRWQKLSDRMTAKVVELALAVLAEDALAEGMTPAVAGAVIVLSVMASEHSSASPRHQSCAGRGALRSPSPPQLRWGGVAVSALVTKRARRRRGQVFRTARVSRATGA